MRSSWSLSVGGPHDSDQTQRAHKSDNLILIPDISATDAARRFSDVLDSIEHEKTRYTIIRRGKAVALLEPISSGRGSDVKKMLRRHVADEVWSKDLRELQELIEIDVRP